MKKVSALILALLMLFSTLPLNAFIAEATDINEVTEVTDSTFTEQGYTTYTCTCGGSYVATVTYPTGVIKGYTDYACSKCGDSYRTPWLDETAYEGMTIACVGDSITAAYGVTKDETDYVTLLAEQLGMDYIRLGASGTTLCTDGPRTCNIGKLTEASLNGADVVTIAMGINDFAAAGKGCYELGNIHSTDTSTIYGAARMWCERIVELRKTDSLHDTQFYFVTPVICSWNSSVTSNRDWDQSKTNIHGYTLRDLCNAITEVAALYDVEVIDLNLLSGMYYVDAKDNNTAVFGGDGVHPGEKGHEMMAGALENVLLQNNLRDDHVHTFGSWITTTWPSCIAGKQQRVCSVCSATENRMLEPNGNHRYCAVVTAPTPTQQGYTTYTCSICGDSYISNYTDAIQPYSYRWEMQDNTMVSVTTGGNTANALTLENGSITDGILTGVRYDLQSEVHLYHDLPWVIEWHSTGNWSGMLFGSAVQSPSSGLTYLFRDPGTKLFAFGEYNGSWNNYGIILDCDMTVSHVFRLENRIASDGSNTVYLLVDGQEIDAMQHYYISGSDQNKTVNWSNGKDIVLANIGTTSHPVNGMKLEYLQVWENYHTHVYESAVTAPTCTEQGYTTYTCTSCGYSYVSDYTDKLNLTIIPITSAEVEQGGYYFGRDSKSKTRLRATDQIYVEAGTTVKYNANGLRVFFAIVSGPDANSYLEGGRWYTDSGEFKVTTDGFLSIIISKPNPKDEITVSDYTADIEIHMISECAHDYQVVVTEPTYSSGGYTTHTCTQCGHRYTTGYTDKKIYRILLIGNSFSQDSMREFAAVVQSMMGADFDLEIHLAINAAKTLAWHATQADAGAASYKHRYYFTANNKWIYEDDPLSTLDSIIGSKQWDVITIQSYYPEVNTGTAKGLTGESAEFLSLEKSVPYMLDYIHGHAPQSKVYYFMAWQATTDTTHLDAGRKSFDQILAMTQVLEEYSGSQTGKCFDGVIPVGTAIQNARSTYLGLLNYTAPRDAEVVIGLQRDSVHMAYSIGTYIAALTWAEYLFPEEVRAEGYVLSGVPESFTLGALPFEYSEIAQKAVAAALKNPYTVNALDGYEVDPADVAKEAIERADYCFSGITNETKLLAAIKNLVTSHLTKTGFDEPTITVDSYTLKNGVVTDLTATVTFRFGYTTRTINITKHFHKYTSVVTEPTCTDKGFTTYTCGCGDYYVDDYVDATGHDYTDGICTLCGVRQTSTFQILDTRSNQTEIFTYEVGMTWKEWLNSKYNTGMGSCIAIDVSVGPDILGGNPYMDICVNGIPVDYDDVICEQDDLELIGYR